MAEPNKYFYVYARPGKSPKEINYSTALVVDGKIVESREDLNLDVVYVSAHSAWINGDTILLDKHPGSNELGVKLDSGLVGKLKSIGGWDIP